MTHRDGMWEYSIWLPGMSKLRRGLVRGATWDDAARITGASCGLYAVESTVHLGDLVASRGGSFSLCVREVPDDGGSPPRPRDHLCRN